MELHERILKYIENHHPISYTTIINVAAGKGFNEAQTAQALEKVHRSKSIVTKTRKDEIWYDLAPAPVVATTPTHITWWRSHYPTMTAENDGSYFDIDLSWLFLKTVEERDAFKAALRGVTYVPRKKHEYARR